MKISCHLSTAPSRRNISAESCKHHSKVIISGRSHMAIGCREAEESEDCDVAADKLTAVHQGDADYK